jgi:pimeloyl-ACP methyl ester carboxylesterase
VTRTDAPEVSAIYGGEMTPEAFELFEAARAETSRLGWEPFMFSPSLPYRLEAVEAETLIVWGEADRVAPEDCARRYAECVPAARLATLPEVGHRPEIEATDAFVDLVAAFLRTPAEDR